MSGLDEVIAELRAFNRDRDWERYHDPKNLAMAVASEAGELLAHFRWVAGGDADALAREPERREAIAREAADVGITLLLFCDRTGIDLVEAMRSKIGENARRYPAEAYRGRWRPDETDRG